APRPFEEGVELRDPWPAAPDRERAEHLRELGVGDLVQGQLGEHLRQPGEVVLVVLDADRLVAAQLERVDEGGDVWTGGGGLGPRPPVRVHKIRRCMGANPPVPWPGPYQRRRAFNST